MSKSAGRAARRAQPTVSAAAITTAPAKPVTRREIAERDKDGTGTLIFFYALFFAGMAGMSWVIYMILNS
jgi:hypothetical protein